MSAYYRLAGPGAATTGWFKWDMHDLARVVFDALQPKPEDDKSAARSEKKPSRIDLAFGVLLCGSSYVLCTEDQMRLITLRVPEHCRRRTPGPPRPEHAQQYASISPITFDTAEALHEKLKTYKQGKKRNGRDAQFVDTSSANKHYQHGTANISRPSFEHQRLLYTLIVNPDPSNLRKFSLPEHPFWLSSTSFVALIPDTWTNEQFLKSRNEPTILNLHLACIPCMAFRDFGENYDKAIKNEKPMQVKESRGFSNKIDIFKSKEKVEKELLKQEQIGERLKAYFSSIKSKNALLLVYDATKTLNGLKKLGIDVSGYTLGIDELLYGAGRVIKVKESEWEDSKPFGRNGGAIESTRKRSCSPSRNQPFPSRARSPLERKPELDHGPATDEDDEDEDDESPAPAKIHVIDVQSMFLAMSKLDIRSVVDLRDLGRRLDIPYNAEGGPSNACALLIEAWRRMASGNAIDEQNKEIWERKLPTYEQTVRPVVQTWARPDGDDYDPNDVQSEQLQPQSHRPRIAAGSSGLLPPLDSSDEDDEY